MLYKLARVFPPDIGKNVGRTNRVGVRKSGAQEGTRTPTLFREADFKSQKCAFSFG